MHSPPEGHGLAALEAAFAAVLDGRDDGATIASLVVEDGIPAADRLQYYRNNVEAIFEDALARTYPVLRRRVGDAHFATLAREYRSAHPSRSGDLHWVGREFPSWLAGRHADSDYEWLADLARLEWACEESLVAERHRALGPDSLAAVAARDLADVRLSLQPSARLVSSDHPVWSVWRANQPDAAGDPVDPALGPESVIVVQAPGGIVLHSVSPARHRMVAALAAGSPLIDSLEVSGLDMTELEPLLRFLFDAGLVSAVIAPGTDPGASPH